MRFIHTSDWHLGATDCEHSLLDDQRHFIDEIFNIAKEKDVDGLLISGDVYDRSIASADAIKLYDYAMTRFCNELDIPVLIIAGNHDSAERLSSCNELLSKAGLHVVGSAERELKKVSFDDTDVYMLPWITEEKIKSLFPEKKEEINSLEEAYKVILDNARDNFDKNKKHIILSHAFITNSELSTSDRAAEIGFATQVSAEVFNGFDYVALGHIHKPQDITDKIRYSGTPMAYSFGREEKQEKSITIIDTETMSKEIVPLHPLHKRTTLTGTLDEMLNPSCSEDVKNGYVYIQVTDEYLGLNALTELRGIYPLLLCASGKRYESEDNSVTMTLDELDKMEASPVEVFKYFCSENMKTEPSERLIKLFEDAIKATEEGNE